MSISTLLVIILAGAAGAYFVGYTRSQQIAKPLGGVRNLATLPSYYATSMSLWALIPSLLLVVFWTVLDGAIIDSLVRSELPTEAKQLDDEAQSLLMSQVTSVANGVGSIDSLGAEYQPAVDRSDGERRILQTIRNQSRAARNAGSRNHEGGGSWRGSSVPGDSRY